MWPLVDVIWVGITYKIHSHATYFLMRPFQHLGGIPMPRSQQHARQPRMRGKKFTPLFGHGAQSAREDVPQRPFSRIHWIPQQNSLARGENETFPYFSSPEHQKLGCFPWFCKVASPNPPVGNLSLGNPKKSNRNLSQVRPGHSR